MHKTRPRVGLVWSGNAAHTNDQNRSFPLADLADRLPAGVDFISLQKEIRPADPETLAQHPQILRLDEEIRDFSDTAALCALVDVVLSVDTSVAHLAGALGRPVWIALPFNPDWRWMLDRRDSPWYPSATLYRQASPGRWDDVMARLGRDLARLAPRPSRGGLKRMKPVFRHPAQAGRAAAARRPNRPRRDSARRWPCTRAASMRRRGRLYEEVLKLQPAHFDALHLMGVLVYQAQDPAAAVEWMDKALAVNARHAPAHNNRGAALKDLGQWDAALASYDKAIALKADYAEAWNNRAVVLRELGQHQAAHGQLPGAIARKADYADAWNNLGNALAHLKQYGAALENYDQAVRFKPDYADAWYNRGNTLAQLGRYAAAVESHDRAIALKAGHADAFNNRGTALAAMGEHQAAIEQL